MAQGAMRHADRVSQATQRRAVNAVRGELSQRAFNNLPTARDAFGVGASAGRILGRALVIHLNILREARNLKFDAGRTLTPLKSSVMAKPQIRTGLTAFHPTNP